MSTAHSGASAACSGVRVALRRRCGGVLAVCGRREVAGAPESGVRAACNGGPGAATSATLTPCQTLAGPLGGPEPPRLGHRSD